MPKSFSKLVKIGGHEIQLDFYKRCIKVSIKNPFVKTECVSFHMESQRGSNGDRTIIMILEALGDKIVFAHSTKKALMKITACDPPLCFFYRCLFTVKHWKNSSYDFRFNAETRIQNFIGMLVGATVPVQKLSNDMLRNMGLDEPQNKDDKRFMIEFSLTEMLSKTVLVKFNSDWCDPNMFIDLVRNEVWSPDCQVVSDASLMCMGDIKKPFFIDNTIQDWNNHKYHIYLKPNGLKFFHHFLSLMKHNFFCVEKILVCQTTDQDIKYFYENAHMFLYGQHWYQYLKSNKMVFLEFRTNLSLTEMKEIKSEFRKLSGVNWTLNVCHMAINESEEAHFANFFNCKFDNLPVLEFSLNKKD